jgi:hypothetical protein
MEAKLNYPYQPVRGKMHLPPDCQNLDEFDWSPCDPFPGSTHAGALPPETARKAEQGVI